MKIEIEIDQMDMRRAPFKIDGREMCVKRDGASTILQGIKSDETESTFGGMVASKIHHLIGEIMDGLDELGEYGHAPLEPWAVMDDEAAESVYDRLL